MNDFKRNFSKADLIGMVAGFRAVACKEAGEALFEAGGKKVFSDAAKQLFRESAGSFAETTTVQIAGSLGKEFTKGVGEEGAKQIASKAGATIVVQTAETTAKQVPSQTAKLAAQTIAGQAGRAAGLGALIDGVIGACEATAKYRRGEIDGADAVIHVVKEAGTGAASSAVGVGAAAALVAFTGPVSVPVLFGFGAAVTVATKLGLTRLLG